MSWSIKDKTVVLTGASAGIGRETARVLAERGARVIMVCRNRAKAEPLLREIPRGELVIADLSLRTETKRAAEEILAKHSKIEVLINNAGAIFSERRETSEGLEQTFALNHLAYFHLTQLLLERIKGSAPARIINVASRAHARVVLDVNDLEGKQRWSDRDIYGKSKLMNVMYTYALARRLEGTRVTANCLHPGVIASDFGKSGSSVVRGFFSLARPFLASTADGAKTTLRLACDPALEGVSGKYFSDEHETASSRESHDRAKQESLWASSERYVG
jgi:NAD(P)-dependent dehydrogenase (short-subunit alcohol dehydrogenase family)